MARIVRLTESDLSRIVRRVINEEESGKMKFAEIKSKMSGCFSPSRYPNLYKASNGSLDVVMGLLAMGIANGLFFASFGLSSFASYTLGAVGIYSTGVGVKKIYDANISKIRSELGKLYNCLF
jgi:hypothetical protein